MEWFKVKTAFDSEEKAKKAATILAATEARLASQPRGPQYDIEVKIMQEDGAWQVYWKKVFIGNQTGCGGGCGSCQDQKPAPENKGKVIPFRRPKM